MPERSSTPESHQDNKRLLHDAFFNYVEIRQQIENNKWLNDETIDSLAKLLHANKYENIRVYNPGYIKFSQRTLARPPPKLTTGIAIIPLNHNNTHWTVAKVDIDRKEDAQRLATWFNPTAEAFSFTEASGPRQKDSRSCGIYVLAAIDYWLRGCDLPHSFQNPSAFLLDVLNANTDTSSTSITPPAKRHRQSPERVHTITSTPDTLAEMLSNLQHIGTTLQAQLVTQPLSSVEDATRVLRHSTEIQQAVEANLQQHQDYIENVIVYQQAHALWSKIKLPSPTSEGLDNIRRLIMSRMAEAFAANVQRELRRLSANGEDKADLHSLEARQIELQVLVKEAKEGVQQANARLETEKKLAAIREQAQRVVNLLQSEHTVQLG
ncbi:uncharacterized protein B0J16DRAFT_372022 [Fusarium flagelliforme]|uniref:uncharacterized protein n=1 Tax=Fusarium flagelliforme TaxID=2675880 RepID=UPI001E8D2715|nr:uncharacterized protein B0J16DRAFT_372022 [Fusarium flagelliforme]KAH7185190.1 hypothetical protein B0J16DRAFT_372022 [Fusarium flagelliforme]